MIVLGAKASGVQLEKAMVGRLLGNALLPGEEW